MQPEYVTTLIERICTKCHKPIKKTKVRVRTVCQCSQVPA